MLHTRFIPVLQLLDGAVVKTVRFKAPVYIGDPVNTVRIFNELEADEMCFLDIRATRQGREPDYALLQQLSDESFCPLSYGGGIQSLDVARRVFSIGFEKVILNSVLQSGTALLSQLAAHYGSQAIVAGIDVKKDVWGKHRVYVVSGTRRLTFAPADWAQRLAEAGAGEILLTSIDREGTWAGYDTDLVRSIADAVPIPVVAYGGAGSVADLGAAVREGRASAVAAGSLVVFQKKGLGVLVNFPDRDALSSALRPGRSD